MHVLLISRASNKNVRLKSGTADQKKQFKINMLFLEYGKKAVDLHTETYLGQNEN